MSRGFDPIRCLHLHSAFQWDDATSVVHFWVEAVARNDGHHIMTSIHSAEYDIGRDHSRDPTVLPERQAGNS